MSALPNLPSPPPTPPFPAPSNADPLVSTVVPVMLALSVLAFLLIGLIVACGRFRRIQRRLHCSVYRRPSGTRTEHFRKKKRLGARASGSEGGEPLSPPARPGRRESVLTFLRTAQSLVTDKTEVETEEAGGWWAVLLLLT